MSENSKTDGLIGREIDDGRYVIKSVIGHGGMASVYLAHQRSVDRLVAIKFIHQRLLVDESLRRRFHREATVMAALSSASCVTVFDYGETSDGLLYIVMERLEGSSLATVLETEGPLTLERFTDWMKQACEGVEAAHRKGLVHRDLKPDNLFVESTPTGRRIKVLDFGLAKILRGDDEANQTIGLTRPGLVFGTPQYMSPEQAQGAPVDVRTDVYAMGLIAYECLAGEPAFRGASPQALLIAQTTTTPPEIVALRPDVPPSIQNTIRRALSKSPFERHSSISSFLSEMVGNGPPRMETELYGETLGVTPEALPEVRSAVTFPTDDSLSPAAVASTPPHRDSARLQQWRFAGAVMVLVTGLFWLLSSNLGKHQAEQLAGGELFDRACSERPMPAYGVDGRPCLDSKTAIHWGFDDSFDGAALGLPSRKMVRGQVGQVVLEAGGVFGNAARFVGGSESRLHDERPFALGDRFTVEGWIKPLSTPELGCGQQILGTANVRGPRQCYDFRIESGWALLMRKSTEGLFELTFHFMHQSLDEGGGQATQVSLGGPAPLFADRWNHFAVVSDGRAMSVVVNGREKLYDRRPRVLERGGYITLGGYRLRTDGILAAALDEVRVSDVARDIASIKAAYQHALPQPDR